MGRASLQGFLVFCCWLLLLFICQRGYSHPQCLDYKPPFQPPEPLTFCKEYIKFGCCDKEKDNLISQRYHHIMEYFDQLGSLTCGKYIHSILCQECSPYAAHLYDAEDANTPMRQLPGLCAPYCSEFWNYCRYTLSLLLDSNVTLSIEDDREKFCNFLELKDPEYCYPNVLTNAELNANLGTVQADPEGCLQLCLQEVANGLRNPVAMVHADDGTRRFFVAEQLGYVWVYLPNGSRVDQPFLNLTKAVLTSRWAGDERGFLCLALHPRFTVTRKAYVYYSVSVKREERIRISEFTLSSTDMNMLDHSSERILLEVVEPASNHNGGQLLFGYDGYLYIFIGDGGKAGDPFGKFGNSQNKSTLLGKVLRIDVDNNDGRPYSVPLDNPFVGEKESRPEIYAYGVRNMWRCSIDRGDPVTGQGRGRMICGDVGQNKFEEVDLIIKGGNYGWRAKEGFSCYDKKLCLNSSLDDILPIFAYPHKLGKSVTGGYIYRGCEMPNLNGIYIFGDFMSGRLMSLKENLTTRKWMYNEICMGKGQTCNFPKLINSYHKYIISFAEDEAEFVINKKPTTTASTTTSRTRTRTNRPLPSPVSPTIKPKSGSRQTTIPITSAIKRLLPKSAVTAAPTTAKSNQATTMILVSGTSALQVNTSPTLQHQYGIFTTTAIPRHTVSYTPNSRRPIQISTSSAKRQHTTDRGHWVYLKNPHTTPKPLYWTPMPKPTIKTQTPTLILLRTNKKSTRQQDNKQNSAERLQRAGVNRKGQSSNPGKSHRRKYRQGAVRLVSVKKLPDRGRVEIFVKGEWGTVCDDLFNSKAATVVCRQLGFPFALRVAKRAEMGAGNGLNILLDDVECEGTEKTLLECKRTRLGKHNCSHQEDVGVVCGYNKYEN
ncbi:hypothetical protein Z043_103426 [Scleropages formosus]|uniref:SRCR domain-containing protein n=1 Tax=Scleropages formosus TaxID=113540 RepID=A0A0P7VT40_SCLFO|nr:hypothetical protein Z043_103426 [Scleropages formosus]